MLSTKINTTFIKTAIGAQINESTSHFQTPFKKKYLENTKNLAADTLVERNMDRLCHHCEQAMILWIKKERPAPITTRGAAAYLTSQGVLDASLFLMLNGNSLSKSAKQDKMDAFCAMIIQFTKHLRFTEIVKNLNTNKCRIFPKIDEKNPNFAKVAMYLLYSNICVPEDNSKIECKIQPPIH